MSGAWTDPPPSLLVRWPAMVDFHVGTPAQRMTRHERHVYAALKGGSQSTRAALVDSLFRRATDERTLWAAWRHLRSRGGQAPGTNGLRYADYSELDTWQLFRHIRDRTRGETFTLGPVRRFSISKGPGRGDRVLELLNVEDRALERSVQATIGPVLDFEFVETSFAYRPGRSRLHALAAAERLALDTGRLVWVVGDVQEAFPSIPLQRLMDVVAMKLPNPHLLWLIRQLLDLENGQRHGLRQGGSLSPTLLNLYLHHHLDLPWSREHPDIPLLRFADDLLLLCRDRAEAQHAYLRLQEMVCQAGLALKPSPENPLRDLGRGETVSWLGYSICQGCPSELAVGPEEKAWSRLRTRLQRCHDEEWPPLRAIQIICSWVDQLGPAYPARPAARRWYRRLESVAARAGFEEIPVRRQLLTRWRTAHGRWGAIRAQTHSGTWGGPRNTGS